MRWNCPHCGVSLAVSDEKLGSGWSFSRCYKCGGFALIRRAEVNLIKVDKAPVGENVLLPEASETPVMSQQATQNLERYLAEKPAIRPANRKPTPPLPNEAMNSAPNIPFGNLPAPLPENLPKPAVFRALPAAIGMAGLLTISSGAYLYMQGQTLWKSARNTAAKPAAVVLAQNAAPRIETALVTDSVQSNMMAPMRTAPEKQVNAPISVRIVMANSKLRSGPSTRFPIVGIADPQVKYQVVGWKDDWFKVSPVRAGTETARNSDEYEMSAWIRNDLVETIAPAGN